MTLKPLTSCLVLSVFSACGLAPGEVPAEPMRVDPPIAGPQAQRFALTSNSTDGWSLEQHAAVAPADADFTLNASGCRGALSNRIDSARFTFCMAGSNFATLGDVPATVSDCQDPSSFLYAGGSYGQVAIGAGYVVLREGAPVGRLRIADQTVVPESWNGEPVQVTLEFVGF